MCRGLKVPVVEFDASNDAMFPARGLDGKPFIEYTQDRGFFDDIPLDDVLRARTELYGAERIELWKKTNG